MNILLTNTVALNGGEAATIAAIVRILRSRFGTDANVTIFDQNGVAASKYFPEYQFRTLLYHRLSVVPRLPGLRALLARLNRARFMIAVRLRRMGFRRLAGCLLPRELARDLEAYASADVVISSGGTYLTDNYLLAPRIYDYRICLALGKPLIFFTQSMGPFNNPSTRRVLRSILETARLILLRDPSSLAIVQALGVSNPNVHICADAVFALAHRWPSHERARPAGGRMRVVVSVRHWPHFRIRGQDEGTRVYRRAVLAAVEHLVRRHDADVCFLSSCQGISEYSFDDGGVAAEMVQSLPEDVRARVTVDRGFHPPMQIVEMLQNADLVIATRFHMSILALLAGAPTLAIAYEAKAVDLYHRLGLADWCIDIESIDAGPFCVRIDECLADIECARVRIEGAVARETELAWAAGDWIARALPKHGNAGTRNGRQAMEADAILVN